MVSVAARKRVIEIKNSDGVHCIDIYNAKNHVDTATSPMFKRKNKLHFSSRKCGPVILEFLYVGECTSFCNKLT